MCYFIIIQIPYPDYVKLIILQYHFRGRKPYSIAKSLETEGIKVSRLGVHKFVIMYEKTGSIVSQAGSGRLSKVTSQVKTLVEQQMQKDDETTCTSVASNAARAQC